MQMIEVFVAPLGTFVSAITYTGGGEELLYMQGRVGVVIYAEGRSCYTCGGGGVAIHAEGWSCYTRGGGGKV